MTRLGFGRTSCLLVLLVLLAVIGAAVSGSADDKSGKLRFGVGPLQPTPSETKNAYATDLQIYQRNGGRSES